MGKYRALLMFFIGITFGGIISYFLIGLKLALMATLFLYLIIIFVLGIEIYLEARNDKTLKQKEREG